MIVGAIRIGRTFNLGNYESKKVEIEAIPDNGQSFDSLLSEVTTMVDAQGPDGGEQHTPDTGKPAAPKKPESSDPPFNPGSNVVAEPAPKNGKAKGAKSETGNPTKATPAASTATSTTATTTEAVDTPTTNPTPANGKGKARKTAKSPEHEKELTYVLDSQSLDELSERFANLRTMSAAFGHVDNWEGALTQVADQYRKLNTIDADPKVVEQIVAGFKAERNYVNEQRKIPA
jgi:hypothetical protein